MGVIGTGRMAVAMLEAAARLPSVTVRAVASASGAAERARSVANAFNVADSYGDVEALVGRADIDLVYIATETFSHARLSVAALEAGKNVLCEKPFATTMDEAAAVAEAARRYNCLFVEAMWTLLLPAYRYTADAIRGDIIGSPATLVASFGYPEPDANSLSEKGGVLLDRAVYPVSLAVQILGPVEAVDAFVVRNADGTDVDGHLQLRHKGGGCSQLSASFSSLMWNAACVSGPRGSLTIDAPLVGSERVTLRSATGRGSLARPEVVRARGAKERLRALPILRRLHRQLSDCRSENHPYGSNQYLPLLDHVAGLVAAGKRESDVVPLRLSLEVARVIALARASSAGAVLDAGGAH